MRERAITSPRPLPVLVGDDPQIRLLLSEIGTREGVQVLLDLHMPRGRALMSARGRQFHDRNSVLDSDAALAERRAVNCSVLARWN